jgi:hypothetical protein
VAAPIVTGTATEAVWNPLPSVSNAMVTQTSGPPPGCSMWLGQVL